MARAPTPITVSPVSPTILAVSTPYSTPYIEQVKALGATWQPARKVWLVPTAKAAELADILRDCYGWTGPIPVLVTPSSPPPPIAAPPAPSPVSRAPCDLCGATPPVRFVCSDCADLVCAPCAMGHAATHAPIAYRLTGYIPPDPTPTPSLTAAPAIREQTPIDGKASPTPTPPPVSSDKLAAAKQRLAALAEMRRAQ